MTHVEKPDLLIFLKNPGVGQNVGIDDRVAKTAFCQGHKKAKKYVTQLHNIRIVRGGWERTTADPKTEQTKKKQHHQSQSTMETLNTFSLKGVGEQKRKQENTKEMQQTYLFLGWIIQSAEGGCRCHFLGSKVGKRIQERDFGSGVRVSKKYRTSFIMWGRPGGKDFGPSCIRLL